MHFLTKKLEFPAAESADRFGVVAIGGDLSTERLMLAYESGIFPWFDEGDPIIWHSPKDRMVLFPNELRVSKSMRNILNQQLFKVTLNQDFEGVIRSCRDIKRDGQNGTWITDDMTKAYCELHRLGKAKSVEVWLNDELVGGLYGIDLGTIFCGESMFSKVSNASKVAFIYLVSMLSKQNYSLVDCQVYNPHLESLGAREIDRTEFLEILKNR